MTAMLYAEDDESWRVYWVEAERVRALMTEAEKVLTQKRFSEVRYGEGEEEKR